MFIDLDLVPQREDHMTAYELLLSESQERMLIVAKKGREQEIIDIYEKWDLQGVVIGEVTDDGRVRYQQYGEIKADIPADSLVLGGGAPQYKRDAKKPAYLDEVQNYNLDEFDHPENHSETLLSVLASPNIASKRWVFEQYDSMVRTNTISGPGPSDAGVVRIKGTKKALAVKTDCNGRYVYLNPRKGGQIAVAEAARNVVCTGAKPTAITNCLNFGNPYKPEVYWTFKEALAGMRDSCNTLNTPVTGGNVSFYNENPESSVFPTPTIGMLGIIEDYEKHLLTAGFKKPGDVIYYLGAPRKGLGGSEYLHVIHQRTVGDAPEMDLAFEATLQDAIYKANQRQLLTAAHDVSDGGLGITLAEMAIFGSIGAELSLEPLNKNGNMPETLFSEAQSGIVVTINEENSSRVESFFESMHIPCYPLGTVKGEILSIEGLKSVSVEKLHSVYENALPDRVQ